MCTREATRIACELRGATTRLSPHPPISIIILIEVTITTVPRPYTDHLNQRTVNFLELSSKNLYTSLMFFFSKKPNPLSFEKTVEECLKMDYGTARAMFLPDGGLEIIEVFPWGPSCVRVAMWKGCISEKVLNQ